MSRSLSIARLANQFATDDEFGKHYIERLKSIRKDYIQKSLNMDYSPDARNSYAMKAASYNDEIEYFEIAHSIVANPTIVSKLKDKMTKKGFTDIL